MAETVPEDVTVAWERAVAAWDEPARHADVLVLVTKHSCFAWAAARYKERAGDPIADAQLERVRKAATATLLASAAARPDTTATPYKSSMMILIVLVILIAVGLAYALVKDRGNPVSTTTDVQH